MPASAISPLHMKTFFFLFLFLLTLAITVYSYDSMVLPGNLSCTEIMNVYGTDGGRKLYKIDLNNLDSGQPISHHTAYVDKGRINLPRNSDRVTISFSAGENFEKVVFKKDDLIALQAGKVKIIRGLHEMGSWWAHGDRTDRLTVIQCR
jgi:hypothetical protein